MVSSVAVADPTPFNAPVTGTLPAGTTSVSWQNLPERQPGQESPSGQRVSKGASPHWGWMPKFRRNRLRLGT